VAWFFELADRVMKKDPDSGKVHMAHVNHRTHSYIGRPNRYRALEVRKFLRAIPLSPDKSTFLLRSWQAEFDKTGLTAYKIMDLSTGHAQMASPSFWAYHPHSSEVEVVEAFSKPLFVKFIGGHRLYSQKKRLSQEAVDAFYEWYHTQFKRRLRRPKALPTAIVNGEAIENPSES